MQYGGLSRAGDLENGPPKPASEFTIKGGEKVFLEIDGIEVRAAPPPFRRSVAALENATRALSDCCHVSAILHPSANSDSSGRKETTHAYCLIKLAAFRGHF